MGFWAFTSRCGIYKLRMGAMRCLQIQKACVLPCLHADDISKATDEARWKKQFFKAIDGERLRWYLP
jgi:hypothetical protein